MIADTWALLSKRLSSMTPKLRIADSVVVVVVVVVVVMVVVVMVAWECQLLEDSWPIGGS